MGPAKSEAGGGAGWSAGCGPAGARGSGRATSAAPLPSRACLSLEQYGKRSAPEAGSVQARPMQLVATPPERMVWVEMQAWAHSRSWGYHE
eukprot:6196353-Prymnesium_polylepis.1